MGSRYGVKIRKLENAVLKIKRAKHICPKCGKQKVKRLAKGVWHCGSCEATFAGGAYSPTTQQASG
ncbi:MAG: transposase [Candidatus Micrarchaeia archaeon]